jgi:oxalate decarboxylase
VPHWHPITAEMGYVHEGSGRMTVMEPDGTFDTWYLEEGDVYFIRRHRLPGVQRLLA